ncbi:MAG TPA: toxin, partial [Chloroflexota bacterium]|nr:toxin [Chloroflexota bacterium]
MLGSAAEIPYEQSADNATKQKRLIEHVRTLYRGDDLTGLLPFGELGSLAVTGESYKLAFTPGLLAQVYKRDGQATENLLPNPAAVLPADVPGGLIADRGGYMNSQTLRSQNLFPTNAAHQFWAKSDADGHWWIPSGRASLSPRSSDTSAQELDYARQHFFLPHRFQDPFGATTTVAYDSNDNDPAKNHDLLVVQTRDPLDNTVLAANDYRVLQPRLITDANRNRTEVAFDTLGMVAGTSVKGKDDSIGDTLTGFEPDLTRDQVDGFYDAADPHVPAPGLLEGATTRIIYDPNRFQRSRQAHPADPKQWLPVYAATLARETHDSDPLPPQGLKIQVSFSYSDGFGREIQKKIQAEPGPLIEGGPVVSPRWVGSGWTIYNNKGNPVRQYEPFFSQLPEKRHRFEFGVKVGVSSILFYDPAERVVATLHPNHTYEKVVFDPWQQTVWDANDTVTLDPSTDKDVKAFFLKADGTSRLPMVAYLPTWQALRTDPAHAAEASQRWPDPKTRSAEKDAAEKAAKHANTPTTAHLDTLGRPFLTLTHNGFEPDGTPVHFPTRVMLDIEDNQREVRDAIVQNDDTLGRIVMRYDYDMLGNRVHQASMEAGERWMLNDVTGKPIRAWDNRRFLRRMTYDELRRPTGLYVTENGAERLAERTVYGESLGDSENHRTRVHKVCDGAGVVINEAYDFKGNLLRSKRELLPNYKQAVDWKQDPTPDGGTFTSSTSYDALDRPLTVTTPDNSVYSPTFNEANLLDKVDVKLRGAAASTPFVSNIDYDAKGQRTLMVYGNGA